jgi:hypothetical protein
LIKTKIPKVNIEQNDNKIIKALFGIYMDYVSTVDTDLDYYTEFIENKNRFNNNIKEGVRDKIITFISERYH